MACNDFLSCSQMIAFPSTAKFHLVVEGNQLVSVQRITDWDAQT